MSRRTLDSAAAWLQESPSRKLRLEGFADPSGASTYNDDLSYRRADAAKRHLVAQGIDPARVNVVGQGEMSPAGLAGGSQQRAVMVMYCEGPARRPLPRTGGAPAEPAPEALAQAEAQEELPPSASASHDRADHRDRGR